MRMNTATPEPDVRAGAVPRCGTDPSIRLNEVVLLTEDRRT